MSDSDFKTLLVKMFTPPFRINGNFYIVDSENRLVGDFYSFSDDQVDRRKFVENILVYINSFV